MGSKQANEQTQPSPIEGDEAEYGLGEKKKEKGISKNLNVMIFPSTSYFVADSII